MTEQIRLEEGWKARLNDEFTKPYMQELRQFLVGQIAANKTIYPKGSEYFDALNITALGNTAGLNLQRASGDLDILGGTITSQATFNKRA